MRSFPLVALLLTGACAASRPYQPPVEITQLFAGSTLTETHIGVAYCDSSGTLLWGIQPDRLFVPASNTKLVTSALALRAFGPGHRFTTSLVAKGEIRQGVLHGDLLLVAGADPLLTSADLKQLAQQAYAAGLRRVSGRLLVDVSVLDELPFGPGWMWDDDDPPISGLVVDGNVGALPDPVLANGHKMGSSLTASGIRLSQGIDRGTGTGKVVASHQSPPLSEVLVPFNKQSNNLIGEVLFKASGGKVFGWPGSWDKGAKAVEALFEEIGAQPGSFRIVDGSGLSRYNLLSPRHLAQLLAYELRTPHAAAFVRSLPVAGRDGTLKSRMVGSRAEGAFQAKTGTMSGVSSLSGYLTDGRTPRGIVSILMNGYVGPSGRARQLQDQLVDLLFRLSHLGKEPF